MNFARQIVEQIFKMHRRLINKKALKRTVCKAFSVLLRLDLNQ